MIKILLLLFITTLISYSNDIFDEDHLGCGKFNSYKSLKNYEFQSAINFPRRNYDIELIELNVDWTNPLSSIGVTGDSRTWSAEEIIHLKIDSSITNTIEFDMLNIRVDNIEIIDFNKNYNINMDNNLVVNFEENLELNSELKIKINYTYIGQDDVGFLLVDKGIAPEKLAYTMSQPYDARNWLICNDYPYEKQIFKLNLKLPLGFVGASNGIENSITEFDDHVIYSWSHKYPISSYLMVINASKFYRYDYKVPRIENKNDSILLDNYIWEVDYTKSDEDSSPYYADKTLDIIPDMTIHFQEIFGPYPFDKFGTVTVEKFWAAGMEHQSIQTIRRQLLNGGYAVLAHELAHMWLGDLVTPTSWRDLWLNEGGAQWSEALWEGYLKGQENGYQYKMIDIKRFYLNRSNPYFQPPIYLYDIESTVFGNDRWYIIYQKASWIYHQLMNFIGEEQFFEILNEYFKEYAYKSIDGETFISFFEERAENPLMPIRKFFDQFLYSAGHPLVELRYYITQNQDQYDVTINLNQLQSQIQSKHAMFLDLYEFPFVIDFYKDDEVIRRDTIIMDEIQFYTNFTLDFEPHKIEINENFTFFQLAGVVNSVNRNSVSNDFKVNPNPINNGEDISLKFNINKAGNYKIALYDINGIEIEELFNQQLNNGEFEFTSRINNNISSGLYFIKAIGPEIYSQKIILY